MKLKFILLLCMFAFAVNAQETSVSAEIPEGRIYELGELDVAPEYPGGLNEFFSFIYKNYNVPNVKENVNVTAMFSFIVETNGTISTITILKDPGRGFADEGVRVIKLANKKWKPGVKNGNAVRSLMKLPLKINIQ